MKNTVILGITGSIAAYKSLELIKLLRQENIDVFVIMTKTAARIADPAEFEKSSGHKVHLELFDKEFNSEKVSQSGKVEHINLAGKANLMVIAPATANTIAKLAYGFADDFLTTTALAITSPLMICPAMNTNMWNNPAVKENIGKLKARGCQIIDPIFGMLACGYKGKGKLQDVEIIKEEILTRLNCADSLKGKKVIVTAGGTIEKIDDVRYIANRSSGKMGIAIAEECFLRGADALLLRAKNSVKPRYAIKEETFNTAEELFELVKKNIKNYSVIYHVAAVSDFQVAKPFKGKLPSSSALTLKLQPKVKILNQIKQLNPKITLIAFKAEYGLTDKELIKKSEEVLKAANAEAIIANDVGKKDIGFDADKNEVFILLSDGTVKHLPKADKRKIAENIISFLQGYTLC